MGTLLKLRISEIYNILSIMFIQIADILIIFKEILSCLDDLGGLLSVYAFKACRDIQVRQEFSDLPLVLPTFVF